MVSEEVLGKVDEEVSVDDNDVSRSVDDVGVDASNSRVVGSDMTSSSEIDVGGKESEVDGETEGVSKDMEDVCREEVAGDRMLDDDSDRGNSSDSGKVEDVVTIRDRGDDEVINDVEFSPVAVSRLKIGNIMVCMELE